MLGHATEIARRLKSPKRARAFTGAGRAVSQADVPKPRVRDDMSRVPWQGGAGLALAQLSRHGITTLTGRNGEVDLGTQKKGRPTAASPNRKLSVRSGHHTRRVILSTMECRVAKPRKTDEHHRPSRRLRHTAGLRHRWPRHVELECVRGGACGK